MGLYSAAGMAISMLLVGLGFWTLTTIGKLEAYNFVTDDTDCCNGNATDCCC